MPVVEPIAGRRSVSAWAPLGEPLFRSLWIASVISYTGTWMQNVGAGWLMTQMTLNPLMVGLVQAAAALPVFLVILPAGALADMVDRRRFLLVTQGWMVLASGTLGILTLTSCVGPWVLLLFTFLLGLGAVMNDPAWQAITPELVPAEQHASAVALNSAGFNVARAVGPALGGIIVAAVGCGTTFLLNAVSFLGVILFLYHWKRPIAVRPKTQRVGSAIGDGFRYVKQSGLAKSVLLRTGTFSVAAVAMLALLPIIARPYGAGIRRAPRLFGTGRSAGSAGAASVAGKAFGGWCGGRRHPDFCRDDFCRRTGGDLCAVVCGDAGGGWVLDRNSGLFECRGADDVSGLCSRPGFVVLSAGIAGRHGGGSDAVGRAGEKSRNSRCAGRSCGGAGAGSVRAARAPHYGE